MSSKQSWGTVPLIELIDSNRPITYGILKPGPNIEDGVPYVRVVDLQGGEVQSSQIRRTTTEIAHQYRRSTLNVGDVLMSIRGHVGRCGVVPTSLVGANITQDTARLAVNEKCDSRFLLWCLRSPEIQRWMVKHTKGVAVTGINLGDVKQIPIPLPPLSEQKRIAGILDQADGLRRKRQQALALTDQFLRSTFLDLFGDPVTNPKRWPVRMLGDVIEFVGGSQPPKDTFISEPREGYVRLVQIRDFKTDKYKTYIPTALAKRAFQKDDVMIARYGPPVFQILRGLEGSYNVALMKAAPTKHTTKDFIFHLLQIPTLHSFVVSNSDRTAGQSGVNLDLLNKYEVPIPPVDHQRRMSKVFAEIDTLRMKSRNAPKVADALFNSLVQRAFRGEL